MSKVIRSTKIDKSFFPLIIDIVAQDVFTGNAAAQEVFTGDAAAHDKDNRSAKTEDMCSVSEEIITASQEQARQIVAVAKQQGQELLLQAKNEGYKEGFAKGREEGLAQAQAETLEKMELIRVEAKNTLGQAEQIRAQLLGGAEEEVVELAMTIASKVIRSHVEVKRDTVVHLAGEALERAISAGFYSIFVNPEDAELLREFISELRRSASGGSRIHIITDASISQGGCKVETEHGLVDMTLESQLEQIRKALRDELERNGQHGESVE